MLKFRNIQIEDHEIFDRYTVCHGYHNIEACFGNIYLWRNAYNIHMATDDIAMYLSVKPEGKDAFLLPPFLDDCETNIGEALRRCEAYMKETYGKPLFLKAVTQQFKVKIEYDCPGEFVFEEDRANYEYVYLSDDLANLVGKKYHAKRNHINKLVKNHEFEYRRNEGKHNNECIALQKKWIESKGGMGNDYKYELGVIQEAFDNMDELGMKCGMLYVDGTLEAFSIGQQYGDDMVIIHIEKANPDIQGAFPLINREFVRHEWAHIKYINREEDMGIEGLRRAKMSYNPVFLLEKYTCRKTQA